MGDVKFVRSLIGMAPQFEEATAGEALEAGDLAFVASDGDLEKMDGGDTDLYCLVVGSVDTSNDTIADGGTVAVLPLYPWLVFEGTYNGSATDINAQILGAPVAVKLNSTAIEFEDASTDDSTVAVIHKIVSKDDSTIQVRFPSVLGGRVAY